MCNPVGSEDWLCTDQLASASLLVGHTNKRYAQLGVHHAKLVHFYVAELYEV